MKTLPVHKDGRAHKEIRGRQAANICGLMNQMNKGCSWGKNYPQQPERKCRAVRKALHCLPRGQRPYF